MSMNPILAIAAECAKSEQDGLGQNWVDFLLIDSHGMTSRDFKIFDRVIESWLPITCVKDLVNIVSTKCGLCKAKIRSLRIIGHGNNLGFHIGDDFITLRSLRHYETELKKLNSYFGKESRVVFDSCVAGQNIELINELHNLWNGIFVGSYREKQRIEAGEQKGKGRMTYCHMKSCQTYMEKNR